jgi:hypothetical protein
MQNRYGDCASTVDVQDNYTKTSNKIRGGGGCKFAWANVYETVVAAANGRNGREMEETLSRTGET